MPRPFLRSLYSFLFYIAVYLLSAQNHAIDSLKRYLQRQPDTLTASANNELAKLYRKAGLYDSALLYAEQALSLSSKLKYKKGEALAYTNLGNANKAKGNPYEALAYYEKGLLLKKELGDQLGVAFSYNNIGNIYRDQGKFAEALNNFFMCLRGCEALHDTFGIAGSYNNIGLTYGYQGNDADAIKYHLAALAIRKRAGDKEGMAASYGNLAIIYTHQKKYEQALKEHQASYSISESLEDKAGMAGSLIGSANVHALQGDTAAAMSDFRTSLDISRQIGDQDNIAIILVNMARMEQNTGAFKIAEEHAKQSLKIARTLEALQTEKEACEIISQICERTARYTESLLYYREFVAARDSLVSEANTKRSVQLEMQYQFDKKEEAARLDQDRKDALALAGKRRQNIILLVVVCFGILVLLFALYAYRAFLQKQKVNIEITRQKALIEEKQKEILDSIHYARRIQTALLTPERYIDRIMKKSVPQS